MFVLSSRLARLTALIGRAVQTPLAFAVASLLLVAALVPGVFLRGEVLSQGTLLYGHEPWRTHTPDDAAAANPLLYDAAYLFYPLLAHAQARLGAGEFPAWSATLYGGHPFLASFQTALLSPFTALAVMTPLPFGTSVKALAPLVVGGLGMFLFVRSIGLHAAACWFAGIAFLLNGFAVAWMEHPLTAVACWLPWILLATDACIASPGSHRTAALALVVSLAIGAGHPETTVKVLMLTAAYAVVGLVRRRGAGSAHVVAAYTLGVLLMALQLGPFLEYLLESEALLNRDAEARNTYFLPAAMAIGGLVPDFFGNPAAGAHVVPPNAHGVVANYAEGALYAGIPVVVLAPIGAAACARDWRVRFFVASALVSLGLMFGAPGLVHAVSAVPFLRVMILTRFGLLVIAALIVLAAYGVDRLTRGGPGDAPLRRILLMTGCSAALGLAAAWLASSGFLDAHGLAGGALRGSAVALVLVVLTVAATLRRLRGALPGAVFAVVVCATLAGDLLASASGFHPTVPADQVYPLTPEIDRVQRDPELFRVYGWGNALVPNAAMAYGLQDVRGWDGMNPFRWTRLLDLGYLRQQSDPERHLRNPVLLDLLNVKYVFLEGDMPLPASRYARVPGTRAPVYLNTRALPRAFLVHDYRVLDEDGVKAALHDGAVDLSRVVLLEDDLFEGERPGATTEPGSVDVLEYRDTSAEVVVSAPARALLVMSDAWYPGWTAEVSGQPVRILRANYALRAVSVPAGRHVVRFDYRPLTIRAGLTVSLLTLLGLLAMIAGLPVSRRTQARVVHDA